MLRYLKGTINIDFVYKQDGRPITGFVDADWGNCVEDRRSYTGFLFLLSGAPISWDSRKQRTVALSTTEAEYMAMSECGKESIYLQQFIRELGFDELANLTIYCDNRSALKLSENHTYHSRSKHIDIRHHFIRELIKDELLSLKFTSSKNQIADFLTKELFRDKHERCVKSAGLKVLCS